MNPASRFSNICVFCGSSAGVDDLYARQAAALGAEIARRGYGLVYGGGNLGLMGAVSRAAFTGGANVFGIIPGPLAAKEIAGETIGRIEVVETMHQRKARMAELSDAFVTLPGGIGTLEELFETISWIQLGIHNKPMGLLNVNGFFDHLLQMLHYQIDQGFIPDRYRSLLVVSTEPAELIDGLLRHETPASAIQWISAEQA
ncbi:MAG: TIGR00730 family Rossman fold protein [Caldilineaceae bacterium]|nr:TIGR00730 family Rossman fold protein [Caldilineaceae bacterium]